MPFYLKDRDISSDISNVGSVLIVPCRFCPAASLAVREKKPFIELFRKFLRTAAYEEYIQELKSHLEQFGIKARVFDSKLPQYSIVCMWTSGCRKKLKQQASEYDAVMVLGCDAAVKTAQDSRPSTRCKVIPGMEIEGIMNVIPSFKFPGKIFLEVTSVIRVLESPSEKTNKRASWSRQANFGFQSCKNGDILRSTD